ncbi:unnamed protein product [Miscanthus lutarioriparius]|uniref:Uncharacterized protein n=1 Tax=Miscanthus lutarioriparius TaxID=422564 RepID=A0A811RCF5_9POAL|nr:unnamed protein product [Miscanthus lutarioriparius]
MEGQAPDATAMEDQPPDAMVGPSLPLAMAAEGQTAAAKRLATRARDDLATTDAPDLDATDAQGLPPPIAQGLAAAVDDVVVPEGSMDGEAPSPATAIFRNFSKNPGSGGEPASPGSKGGGSQETCPGTGSGLGRTYVLTTVTEGAVSAIKQSRQIHV